MRVRSFENGRYLRVNLTIRVWNIEAVRTVYWYLFLRYSTRELKKRNTPMDDDDDHGRPGQRRQWRRSPPMHLPRRIPCTDPTKDMHGQLLVARRGSRRRLGAAIARRAEGRAWRWPTPSRRPDCRPSRWPCDVAAGRSRPRDSSSRS